MDKDSRLISEAYIEAKRANTENLGKRCTKCGNGTYQETGVHDDIDGKLHCTKCNHEVYRHPHLDETGRQEQLAAQSQNMRPDSPSYIADECVEKLLKFTNIDQRIKMIYMWVKQDHINLKEFTYLIDRTVA